MLRQCDQRMLLFCSERLHARSPVDGDDDSDAGSSIVMFIHIVL